jgi:hypothetical protein
MAVQKELMSIPDFGTVDEEAFAAEKKLIAIFQKSNTDGGRRSSQKLMAKIEGEQEVLMNIADMAIVTFNAESALLRVIKLIDQRGEAATSFELDIVRTYLYDAADNLIIW